MRIPAFVLREAFRYGFDVVVADTMDDARASIDKSNGHCMLLLPIAEGMKVEGDWWRVCGRVAGHLVLVARSHLLRDKIVDLGVAWGRSIEVQDGEVKIKLCGAKDASDQARLEVIKDAVARYGGITAAAEALGVNRSFFYQVINRAARRGLIDAREYRRQLRASRAVK